jgi:hypothetical protein
MQLLGARRHAPRHASTSQYIAHAPSVVLSTRDGLDQTESRYEPQSFGLCRVPADPYTAWLEQREADRELDDHPQVRWVVRPRAVAGPAAVESTPR